MTHLTREELVAWRDRPNPDFGQRIIAHLAACDACSATCAEVVRTRPAELLPVRFAPADFAPHAYSLYRRHPFASARLGALVPLGLAAMLAIIVLVPLLRERPQAPVHGGSTRAGRITRLQPSGTIAEPVDFSWEAAGTAYTYRIEVKNQRGMVLLSRTVASPHLELTPDVWRRFSEGERYTWTVTALDSGGRATATSEPQSFTVAPER